MVSGHIEGSIPHGFASWDITSVSAVGGCRSDYPFTITVEPDATGWALTFNVTDADTTRVQGTLLGGDGPASATIDIRRIDVSPFDGSGPTHGFQIDVTVQVERTGSWDIAPFDVRGSFCYFARTTC